MIKHISNSLEETEKIAWDFVMELSPRENGATVVGLYGDLGAGKTTFTQGLAKALNVSDNVLSPTFVIMKVYELPNSNFKHLIHIDAYRIDHSSELLHLGWQEIISDPHNLIIIEWPERIADIMPEHIKINLKTLENQDSREMEIVT